MSAQVVIGRAVMTRVEVSFGVRTGGAAASTEKRAVEQRVSRTLSGRNAGRVLRRLRLHAAEDRWLAERRDDWRWEAACQAAMATLWALETEESGGAG